MVGLDSAPLQLRTWEWRTSIIRLAFFLGNSLWRLSSFPVRDDLVLACRWVFWPCLLETNHQSPNVSRRTSRSAWRQGRTELCGNPHVLCLKWVHVQPQKSKHNTLIPIPFLTLRHAKTTEGREWSRRGFRHGNKMWQANTISKVRTAVSQSWTCCKKQRLQLQKQEDKNSSIWLQCAAAFQSAIFENGGRCCKTLLLWHFCAPCKSNSAHCACFRRTHKYSRAPWERRVDLSISVLERYLFRFACRFGRSDLSRRSPGCICYHLLRDLNRELRRWIFLHRFFWNGILFQIVFNRPHPALQGLLKASYSSIKPD